MSVLIRPDSSRAAAFRRGFLKGLGAPVVLFGTFDINQASDDDFKPIELPKRERGSVKDDWRAVGKALSGAAKLG